MSNWFLLFIYRITVFLLLYQNKVAIKVKDDEDFFVCFLTATSGKVTKKMFCMPSLEFMKAKEKVP